MQRLLNQRRTIYWLANFVCAIVGVFVLTFGLLGWGIVSTIIGIALILVAYLFADLALRT